MTDLEREFFADGTPSLTVENFCGLWGVADVSRGEWINDHTWFTYEDAKAELIRILKRHPAIEHLYRQEQES